jgi:translation elongation factor EF-4
VLAGDITRKMLLEKKAGKVRMREWFCVDTARSVYRGFVHG